MKRRRWPVVLGVLVLGTVALIAGMRPLIAWTMTPSGPFDAAKAPRAPDYADDAAWSALPGRVDLADRAPPGFPAVDDPKADVFYVHPTTSVANGWNGPVDDADLNAATDRVATGIQAAAFNGCCAVYAPRYRQANGTAFYKTSADGDRAIDLAYQDVHRAFVAFHARRGANRPFFVAAHSQGSVLAERLLTEAIAGTPLRDLFVAAYLPGGRVTAARLPAGLAPCATATDVRCVAAWNARGAGYRAGPFEMHQPHPGPLLCTNPLTWTAEPGVAAQNLGAVFLESDDPSPRPGFADARCEGGTLVVSLFGVAPRDLPSKVLDRALGVGNHHPIEVQLFFLNLRQNAVDRLAAFGK